jgi:predicted regulator of Ras-like GTPase activity (Roadblock/LC7/MglB family)
MTPLAWSWLLSLTGAVLFFAAGTAFRLRRFAGLEGAERAALERELAQRTAERQQLFRELEIERSARVTPSDPSDTSGVTDAETTGLRHELALLTDQLTSRDKQVEQLREENTRLRGLEEELGHAKRELATVHEQTRILRAQAFVSKPTPARQRTPTPTLSATGRALQTIVDTEMRLGRAKSAVIADELGLLVAASSATNEYNEALAALGAYLADVGSKTRDILPLRNLRQVTVCDDHDVTLTVRPLATDDPGLALVTLAVEPTSTATDNCQN